MLWTNEMKYVIINNIKQQKGELNMREILYDLACGQGKFERSICRNGYHEAENISSHKKGKLYFVKLWW